jgi:hypothetical protein
MHLPWTGYTCTETGTNILKRLSQRTKKQIGTVVGHGSRTSGANYFTLTSLANKNLTLPLLNRPFEFFHGSCIGRPSQTHKSGRSAHAALISMNWWLVACGFWLLASGFWLLASGFWLLAVAGKLCRCCVATSVFPVHAGREMEPYSSDASEWDPESVPPFWAAWLRGNRVGQFVMAQFSRHPHCHQCYLPNDTINTK